MIDTSLFPYDSFGVRLEIPKENKIAWFKDDIDLQKHIDRYQIKSKEMTVIRKSELEVEEPKKKRGRPKNVEPKKERGKSKS